MPFTHSFTDVAPPARYDGIPWSLVRIEESADNDGPWTQIDEQVIAADPSPAVPDRLDLTTTLATVERGYFRFVFVDTLGNVSPSSTGILSPGSTVGVYYTSPQALRDELEVTEATLTDADAVKVIAEAEDVIDGMLGFWRIDDTTGRKIVEDQVEAWQFAKLSRATLLLAVNLYRNPQVMTSVQWDEIKGPDFWFVGRIGGPLAQIITPNVTAVLDQSTLRRLSARSRAGARDRPPWYSFTHNDPDEW